MQVENNLEVSRLDKKVEANKGMDGVSQFIKTNQTGMFTESVLFGSNEEKIFNTEKTTKEEIEQAAGNQASEFVRETLASLSKDITGDDLTKLNEEGTDVENQDVKTIVTETDKIKAYLATHSDEYTVVGDLSEEALAEVSGGSELAAKVAVKMAENNVSVNKENVEEATEAVKMASQISDISEATLGYLISNDLPITIENIYKAEHSAGGITTGTYGAGYYSTGSGYLQKASADIDWNSLQGQIEKVIVNAGLQIDENTTNEAKWLISNHLPLTEETLTTVDELGKVEFPLDEEKVIANVVENMSVGGSAKGAYIAETLGIIDRAKEASDVINNATDEDLITIIEENKTINIQNLKAAINERTSDDSQNSSENENAKYNQVATDEDIKLVTARRQLEEIRLQMTVEANIKMLKQGISIETKPLEELVNELKKIEANYYNQLFEGAKVEATEENIDLFKEVTSKVEEIKYVPSYTIGGIVSGETSKTVNEVHSKGTALKNRLDKASESYEALMTKPRADMGDKISTAFRNVDDILEDMGLETTSANQRAVRILGYNSMEITEENIMSVKSVDSEINRMFQAMTPSTVLKMIREKMNPLDMNISELNLILEDMQDGSSSNEKYSEFLWKLEQNNEITEAERATYIGMYRLLNSVEKTDGAVVGALVNQNADITLNNLLMGVRTYKNKGVNVSVDDNFGGLESVGFKTTNIDEQLSTSFNGNQTSSEQNNSESQTYYENLVNETLNEMSPEKLMELLQNPELANMTLESFRDALNLAKEDTGSQKEYLEQKLESMKQAASVEESVIKALEGSDQPVTINNILAANQMFNARGSLFKKLLNQENTEQSETSKELEDKVDNLLDSLTDEDSFKTAYEEMTDKATELVDEMAEEAQPEYINIKELSLMRNEITLATNLSREEKYQIPVEINDELTTISLTVIHNADSASRVALTMSNERFGDVAATFSVKNGQITGYAATTREEAVKDLANAINMFANNVEEIGLKVDSMQAMYSDSLNINKFESEQAGGDDKSPTVDLYRASKMFIEAIKGSDIN